MPTDNFDLAIGTGLLLFTGAEVAVSDTVIEIISKFGVIAVLWYWLQDMRKNMRAQLQAFEKSTSEMLEVFDKETNEIGSHYDRVIEDLRKEYLDYKDRWDITIRNKEEEIRTLHQQMLDLYKTKAD